MSVTHNDERRDRWSFRAQIGFYLVSTALTAIGLLTLIEYRNEVRSLREDRDHDYRERLAWTMTGWVSRSRKQDANLGLIEGRLNAVLAHCSRQQNGCNLPAHLADPVTTTAIESTEALMISAQEAMRNAPNGTRCAFLPYRLNCYQNTSNGDRFRQRR